MQTRNIACLSVSINTGSNIIWDNKMFRRSNILGLNKLGLNKFRVWKTTWSPGCPGTAAGAEKGLSE